MLSVCKRSPSKMTLRCPCRPRSPKYLCSNSTISPCLFRNLRGGYSPSSSTCLSNRKTSTSPCFNSSSNDSRSPNRRLLSSCSSSFNSNVVPLRYSKALRYHLLMTITRLVRRPLTMAAFRRNRSRICSAVCCNTNQYSIIRPTEPSLVYSNLNRPPIIPPMTLRRTKSLWTPKPSSVTSVRNLMTRKETRPSTAPVEGLPSVTTVPVRPLRWHRALRSFAELRSMQNLRTSRS